MVDMGKRAVFNYYLISAVTNTASSMDQWRHLISKLFLKSAVTLDNRYSKRSTGTVEPLLFSKEVNKKNSDNTQSTPQSNLFSCGL